MDIFQEEIDEKGFYHWDQGFQDFKNKHEITAEQRAPMYLSIDFYRQQRRELTDRGWYVIRLGQGSFAVFDNEKYPKPYLELSTSDVKEIEIQQNTSYNLMRKAFKSLDLSLKSAENTLLELARFYNVFETMIEGVTGDSEYHVGPRGGMTQQFDLYFKNVENDFAKFRYDGQVELDYSIWTEDRVFVVEAKSMTRRGLDVGWHKMAFPSHRFIDMVEDNGLKINPVYFLRTRIERKDVLLLYVFTEIWFRDGGIVLNDSDRWKLLKVFSVDLDSFRY